MQEFDASADEAKIEEELELQQASFLFEFYTVPNGSDYHTIAEKQYGNRHLWPVKVAIMILSAAGITNMWIAVFGDVGVSMIAILNAARALKK